MPLNSLVNLVSGYPVYSILIGFFVSIVLLIIVFVLIAKNKKLEQRVSKWEDAILELQTIDPLELKNLDQQLVRQEQNNSSTLRHVAMVRFNAFDSLDHGLSYALAVLSDNGDGFVISSVFAREVSRTYVKQIVDGNPSQPLSPEEENAVAKAMVR